MESDDKIVVLSARTATPSVEEDRISSAVLNLSQQPMRQVNWPAVITFLVISILGLVSGALAPNAVGGGVTWNAVMALMIGLLSGVLAVLYRYLPSLWTLRRPSERRTTVNQ